VKIAVNGERFRDDGYGRAHRLTVLEKEMSDTLENEAIAEALAVIDQSLERVHERGMLTSSEVSDLLLDVRLLLAGAALEREAAPAAN
jgi:hypothetical protein